MIAKKETQKGIDIDRALMLLQKRDAPVFVRMPKSLKDQLEKERRQSALDLTLVDYIILKLAK